MPAIVRAAGRRSGAAPPRVGEIVHRLRQARRLSLDQLSRQAGVSKSMLSQIERAQANPTIAVVWRLANALGLPIGELLAGEHRVEPSIMTVGSQSTPVLATDDKRCELRILGPVELAGKFEWYELRVKPGGALVSQAHERGSREHLTVLDGTMEVKSGTSAERLEAGQTARYAVDVPHAIRNVGRAAARALLVVWHS